jgi:cobalt-zinc-cadmium efflux system protein
MSHQHEHSPTNFGKAFAIGIVLNMAFVLTEAWYGWTSGSLGLLADAAHNLSDVGGLLLAWAALGVGRLAPNARHTYGWRRGSILASIINAIVLLVAMGSLAWEAMQRLQTNAPIDGVTMMTVAAVGVVINAFTAWLFMGGSKHDLNIRGAFLHMAADALVSLGIVFAGALYLWQGWSWIDPVVSLVVALVVIVGTWSLFKRSLHLLFDGVPDGIDMVGLRRSLQALPGVIAMHDLHVWAISTTENALTAHMVFESHNENQNENHDARLAQATAVIHEVSGITHVSLQFESPAYANNCPMNRDSCVTDRALR